MEKICVGRDIKIAVFDSGIGGLNLLKECTAKLPNVSFFYLADNFNVPYGKKSKREIFSLVSEKLALLSDIDLSAAVIACNTATSNCIEEVRASFPFPVIGIQPAVKTAAEYGGRCLVLATPSTVNSRSFNELLKRCADAHDVIFTIRACEGLAEYIEERAPDIGELPRGFLPPVQADSVVLGCTHYLFAAEQIKRAYGCKIFDGISGTVAHLCRKLGIDDHFDENSGIFDHTAKNRAEVTFIGGDFAKNAMIFDKICR